MNCAVIISTKHRTTKIDLAGENIKAHLLKLRDWKGSEKYDGRIVHSRGNISIYTVNNECIHHENIDKKINADYFIFATTHSSASGIHSLSVHSIGNFGPAELGGKEKTLVQAPANLMKALFINLNRFGKDSDFEIIQEVTHHGPFVGKPVVFIEIGSDQTQWSRDDAGEIIAKTIIETLENPIKEHPTAIGIGGPHHSPQFKDITLGEEFAMGHMVAKYNLENLDENTLAQAMNKTVPKASIAFLDWKGLGQHKARVSELLKSQNVEFRKTKDF